MSVYLIENGGTCLNYRKVSVQNTADGYFTVSQSVKNELNIKEQFNMYDKNGCLIDSDEGFRHFKENDCIYVCPKNRDFNYQSLLSMYTKKKKLGQGGYGSVFLLKHRLNSE